MSSFTLSWTNKCLSRPYPFKFFKGCLPQILLGPTLEYFVPYVCWYLTDSINLLLAIYIIVRNISQDLTRAMLRMKYLPLYQPNLNFCYYCFKKMVRRTKIKQNNNSTVFRGFTEIFVFTNYKFQFVSDFIWYLRDGIEISVIILSKFKWII